MGGKAVAADCGSRAAGAPAKPKGILLRSALSLLAATAFLLVPSIARADRFTTLVSGGGQGGAAGSYTDFDAVSQDGSTVIFSTTKRLVPQDTGNSLDIYARTGNTTTLISTGPNGGNGAFPATFVGASQDGSRIFFETEERLVPADTDNSLDVYMWSGGVTTLISTGPTGGYGAYDAYFSGASSDGSQVFFQTSEQLTSADTDSAQDVYLSTGGTTTLISTGPNGGNGPFPADYAGSSADGSHVFFHTNEQLTSDDTDSSQDVYDRSGGTTTLVSIGATGGNGPFNASFEGASDDGSKVFFTTSESLESGDTDNQQDIYQRSGGTTTLLSTGSSGGNGSARANFVGASADGSHVFFETQESLVPQDVDGFIDVYDHTSSGTALISLGGTDNQGATNAYYVGSSQDGSTVFFRTDESLTAADNDGYQDIYQRTGATTTLVSTGTTGGNAAVNVKFGGVSADGSRVFFETYEPLVGSDTDANVDVYERTNGTTTLLSQGAAGGNGPFDAHFAGMTPDGGRVFFKTDEALLSGDTDTSSDLYSADLPGKVVIVKHAQPQDPQNFTFTMGGGLSLGLAAPPGQTTFQLSDGDPNVPNTQTFDNVAPGSGYSVTETVPSGWDQSSATCDNGSSPSNISVAPGETVTCTFANTRHASIVVAQQVQPSGDPQAFTYTAGGGLSPSSFQLTDGNTQNFSNVAPGSGYSVSETVPSGWDQSSATCDNGSSPSNISVTAGATVTCTFSNTKRGSIVVIKQARPQDPQDFSFTAGGGLSPSSFSLDDDNDPTLPNVQTFSNVAAGSGYSVSESPVAPWTQVSATCDNGSSPSNITVAAGQTVTCTFLNEKGYPRPKGATPLRVALVVAYQSCANPNRTHGSPLSASSCAPPVQASNYLTVGTQDANGQQANFVGRVRLDAVQGNPSTPANEADVALKFNMSDIRNKSDLSDYTGEVSPSLDVQITDRRNGPSVNEPGTTVPIPFSVTVPCAATPIDTIGATCIANTSVNALIPGAVVENQRSIWQLDDIKVFDGGADGVVSTQDNTLFARQGVFIP